MFDKKSVQELSVRCELIPFDVSDMQRESQMLITQTGGKAITSQAEAIRQLHGSEKAESIIQELKTEAEETAIEPMY
jgi:hypothetical protein